MNEYDALSMAIEELRFHRELGYSPVGWEVGVQAMAQLCGKCTILNSSDSDSSGQLAFLLDLPILGLHQNPWRVNLISRL